MKSNSYLYLCVALISSFFWMKESNNLGPTTYLLWILVHLILLAPVIAFSYYEDRLKTISKKRIYWIGSFLIAPIVVYYFLRITGIFSWADGLLNHELDMVIIALLLTLISACVFIYFLLFFTSKTEYNTYHFTWIQKASVFNCSVFLFLLLSMVMPWISQDFQKMAASSTRSALFLHYVIYVPQIFIIYFSYYLFYHINHHFLFKKWYVHKGPVAYILGLVGLLLVLTPLINIFISYFPVVYELRIHPIGAGTTIFDDINYIFPVIVIVASFPIILIVEWNKKSADLKILEAEKTRAELTLLKQQINPHFFFNTLNNLYALSLEKADAAPEMILKLSKLMRFVIYKGKSDLVKLSEEIQYIQDYIDLQKLRMKQNVDIIFQTGKYEEAFEIQPLMLIVLVENAFKHGIEPSEKEGFVHVSLEVQEDKLYFTCKNSIDFESVNSEFEGIGISNLKKRLDILYPNKNKLSLHQMDGIFFAELQITL